MKILLEELFKRLSSEKIAYCILRNYEQLPVFIDNDIDIWIYKEDRFKFLNILFETAKNTAWQVISHNLRFGFKWDTYLVKEEEVIKTIHLDCCWFFCWRNILFIDETICFKKTLLFKEKFVIPSKGVEASILLLQNLLYNRKVKEKYKVRIQEYTKSDPDGFLLSINKPFGEKVAKLIHELSRNGQWELLEKKAGFFRWAVCRKSFINDIFNQMRRWSMYLVGQLKKILVLNNGLFIVFIGPDGSGKTTTTNNLFQSEIKRLFQKKIYFHGHFRYLPELKKISALLIGKERVKDVYEKQAVNDKFQNIKPFNTLRAMIYPLYYGMNYFLGHKFIWKEKAIASFIIFDRYFYDYFLQIPYLNCPRWLLYAITKFIPKPDAIIYLKNEPRIIHARKPELPVEEIERQTEICQKMVKRFKNTFVVETSQNPKKVVKEIQEIIINKIKTSQK